MIKSVSVDFWYNEPEYGLLCSAIVIAIVIEKYFDGDYDFKGSFYEIFVNICRMRTSV